MSKFCKKCGQKLPEGFLSNFGNTEKKPVEFKEGWYCYQCAKKRVESARNQ